MARECHTRQSGSTRRGARATSCLHTSKPRASMLASCSWSRTLLSLRRWRPKFGIGLTRSTTRPTCPSRSTSPASMAPSTGGRTWTAALTMRSTRTSGCRMTGQRRMRRSGQRATLRRPLGGPGTIPGLWCCTTRAPASSHGMCSTRRGVTPRRCSWRVQPACTACSRSFSGLGRELTWMAIETALGFGPPSSSGSGSSGTPLESLRSWDRTPSPWCGKQWPTTSQPTSRFRR
mmetsp:Transcript_7946/g.21923  ORF Transcript_7946/g.21923 Transcript_7946/m.21923 type:complete len:233 (+) Transcript_7946:109-807(+)